MNFDIKKHTIHLCLSGSRVYGTDWEGSDWDYRGIAIAPLDYYLGLGHVFEQTTDKNICALFGAKEGSDIQIYDIRKFCKLALDGNPSILEILFTPKKFWIHSSPWFSRLYENRHLFLSRRVKGRFSGYSKAQLARIRGHKVWIDAPPKTSPTRSEYGLPEYTLIPRDQIGAVEQLIQDKINSYMIATDEIPEHIRVELFTKMERVLMAAYTILTDFPPPQDINIPDLLKEKATKEVGLSAEFLEILKRERRYRTAQTQWEQYQTWLKERNPERAQLEKEFGLDTKHASHLVRLLRECRELLETGDLKVNRPDAEELKKIRMGESFKDGTLTYDKLIEWAENEDKSLDGLVEQSKLPKVPNSEKVNDLVCELILEFNQRK